MFLGNIFKKYKEREYRILLIKELIEWLNVDERQKKLYLDSIEILEWEDLDRFYKKLIWVIEIIEEDENKTSFEKKKQEVYNINKEEVLERKKELNSFNMILDNL